ncbi:hypothetical protein BLOT_005226 [Blomia tropicalis]|nr:hypothetical protein BLOT_005226 [Blomia tropicalis]
MEQEKSIIFFTGNGRQIEVTRDKMKSISDRLWGIGEKENITNDSKSNKENERDFYNLSEDDDDIYDELIQIEINRQHGKRSALEPCSANKSNKKRRII